MEKVLTQPTTGPWRLTYSNCWIVGDDPIRGSVVIAKMEAGTLADALLLKSASELLSALKGAEKAIAKALPHLPPDKEGVFCGEWLAEIKSVIATATNIPG